jgi:hypothetical protein
LLDQNGSGAPLAILEWIVRSLSATFKTVRHHEHAAERHRAGRSSNGPILGPSAHPLSTGSLKWTPDRANLGASAPDYRIRLARSATTMSQTL